MSAFPLPFPLAAGPNCKGKSGAPRTWVGEPLLLPGVSLNHHLFVECRGVPEILLMLLRVAIDQLFPKPEMQRTSLDEEASENVDLAIRYELYVHLNVWLECHLVLRYSGPSKFWLLSLCGET